MEQADFDDGIQTGQDVGATEAVGVFDSGADPDASIVPENVVASVEEGGEGGEVLPETYPTGIYQDHVGEAYEPNQSHDDGADDTEPLLSTEYNVLARRHPGGVKKQGSTL